MNKTPFQSFHIFRGNWAALMKHFLVSSSPELPARLGAIFAIGLGLFVLLKFSDQWIGPPLARHMLQHALTMNLAAPAIAWMIADRLRDKQVTVSQLALLTATQLVLLWAWHSPPVFSLVHGNFVLTVAMHSTLFVSALGFWIGVLLFSRTRPFGSIVSLLVTGKIYCLYGVLLIFASRDLFGPTAHSHHAITQSDQQLAGLIMVSACPLTYVAAAVAIVVRWIKALDSAPCVERP